MHIGVWRWAPQPHPQQMAAHARQHCPKPGARRCGAASHHPPPAGALPLSSLTLPCQSCFAKGLRITAVMLPSSLVLLAAAPSHRLPTAAAGCGATACRHQPPGQCAGRCVRGAGCSIAIGFLLQLLSWPHMAAASC
jgi:hypothetical protein